MSRADIFFIFSDISISTKNKKKPTKFHFDYTANNNSILRDDSFFSFNIIFANIFPLYNTTNLNDTRNNNISVSV